MTLLDDAPQDTTAKSRPARSASRANDQFYTKHEVAAQCIGWVREQVGTDFTLWLEPSAGGGAFYDQLPQPRYGIDIDSAREEFEPVSFLDWGRIRRDDQRIITIGNPPFGRNGSMALRFLAHAANFSDYVCFILPRTFEKVATQAKVTSDLELVKSWTLESDSFEHDGRDYPVPCCFQIWRYVPKSERRARPTSSDLTHQDFTFVDGEKVPVERRGEVAHFAFQRVGAAAGLVSTEGLYKSWKSHYLIKVSDEAAVDTVRAALADIDWREVRARTAGNPSIGKGELIEQYVLKTGRPAAPPPAPSPILSFNFGP